MHFLLFTYAMVSQVPPFSTDDAPLVRDLVPQAAIIGAAVGGVVILALTAIVIVGVLYKKCHRYANYLST